MMESTVTAIITMMRAMPDLGRWSLVFTGV
jgi:hypothetical protein